MLTTALLFLLVVLSSWISVPLVRYYARKRLLDLPGKRRLHDLPIPRGGGLVIVLIVAVLLWLLPLGFHLQLGLFLSLTGCALLGWLDDHHPVPAVAKLLVLTGIAIAAVVWLGPVERITILHQSTGGMLLLSALAAFCLLWLLNLFNFMDGSHGLASSQAVLSLLALYWLAVTQFAGQPVISPGFSSLILFSSAAVLGFIPWNFPRPSIFLGDVGSLSLGLLVGVFMLLLIIRGQHALLPVISVAAVFILDATATLIQRMFSGKVWYQPHTEHAYQRLVHLGWSHARVCMVYSALNVLLVWPAIVLMLYHPHLDLLIYGVLQLLLLSGWWLVQSAWSRHQQTLQRRQITDDD